MDEKKDYPFLVFDIVDKSFALHTLFVVEILEMPELMVFTKQNSVIAGVMNYRSTMIPIIDSVELLGHTRASFALTDAIVVLQTEEALFGMAIPPIRDIQFFQEFQPVSYLPGKASHQKTLPFIFDVAIADSLSIFVLDIPSLYDITLDTNDKTSSSSIPPFLERIHPDHKEIFQERAKRFADLLEEENLNKESFAYAIVACAKKKLAIESIYIKELTHLQDFALIPEGSDKILGFINLRGDIVPLADLSYILRKKKSIVEDNSKVAVIQVEGQTLALVIDEITQVCALTEESFKDVSFENEDFDKSFVMKAIQVDSQIIGVLNTEKLLEKVLMNT